MRNPFRIRASQRSVSDEEFVKLFSPGAFSLLSQLDEPFNNLVFLRSAPGGGKTTLLRMLSPRPLRLVQQLAKTTPPVKATLEGLQSAGVIGDGGALVIGAMVHFNKEYRELAAFDKANILFRELVNSRIVIATLRAVMDAQGLAFPDDLSSLSFVWEPESTRSIPARANGSELFEWASQIETNFYERMDDLGTPTAPEGGHARLDALRWFARCSIEENGCPIEAKRLLLFDEMQALASEQRKLLVTLITDAREPIGLWVAERLEALNHQDLLSEGALKERDYEGVIQLESQWRGAKAKNFVRFVENVANLRLSKAEGFQDRDLFALIDEGENRPWDARYEESIETIRTRIASFANPLERYAEWLKTAENRHGSPRDRAIAWRVTEILIRRDMQNTQSSFIFDTLPTDEFERKSKGPERAAEHFLRTEMEAPVYFGREALASVATHNVDQYLEVVGELFELISARYGYSRQDPTPIEAEKQDEIVRRVAKRRWDALVHGMARGQEARRLLESIGAYCRLQTFRPTAPYSPGVTGIAITMRDRKSLIDGDDDDIKAFLPLRSVLTSLVAQNLLIPRLDHQNNGKSFVVFNLNRLLCVHFGLPLGYGGWRHKSLRELANWLEHGPSAEDLGDDPKLV